jgi:hypothetical protein
MAYSLLLRREGEREHHRATPPRPSSTTFALTPLLEQPVSSVAVGILPIASFLPLCISWTQRNKPCKFVEGTALCALESRH